MTDKNEDQRRDWLPAKVRFELEMRGLSLRALSLEAGYSRDSLKAVLRTPCETYEQVIADALGMKPEDIWPSRWEIRSRKRKAA
ncbi:MAG: transcriptional regulator [Kluyvera sp.]|uniref:helix-turn-helix domain-containing protein n=1 Tax=Kluyvera sp. TaxID=1538228 RepID=UPI003A852564